MSTSLLPNDLLFFCDGLCEPNPGGVACWAWVLTYAGRELRSDCGQVETDAQTTNNIAEYEAVIQALRWADKYRERIVRAGQRIVIHSDSQLIVNQVSGKWGCTSEHLLPLRDIAQSLLRSLDATIIWIPREQNTQADALTRRAYRETRRAA